MKQYIFKNLSDAQKYLEEISKEILFVFKKIPKFSKYQELPVLAEPFEKKVIEILSQFNGVVGTNGYSYLGVRSLGPLTKLRINSVTLDASISLPVDFSIWVCFEFGYVEFTFSNVFNNEKITNEYFNNDHPAESHASITLGKVYDRVQANYFASSAINVYKKNIYFDRIRDYAHTVSPETFMKEKTS